MKEKQISQETVSELIMLLYSLANESRTPLSAILGCTHLLLEEPKKFGTLTAEQREFLEIIYKNAKKSTALWNIVLDYAQICYLPTEQSWSGTHMKSVLDEAIEMISRDFARTRIEIDIPELLPPIRSNKHLTMSFVYLLEPDFQTQSQPTGEFLLFAKAQQRDDTLVDIVLQTNIPLETHIYAREDDELFGLGATRNLAERIIKQHDGKLRVKKLPDGTEYGILLPIWSENE